MEAWATPACCLYLARFLHSHVVPDPVHERALLTSIKQTPSQQSLLGELRIRKKPPK